MTQGGTRYFQRGADKSVPTGEKQEMAETVTLTKEQFDALLNARQTTTAPEGLTADALAQAFKQANQRENPQAPMVSVFNPKGETAHPRPPLRCKTFQNGIPMDHDTLTWEEIEALNALPAGSFKVSKANGQRITFDVKITRGLDGDSFDKVEIAYPCKDEHRHDHRSLYDYCVEVLESSGQDDTVSRLTALKKELDGLRRKAVA